MENVWHHRWIKQNSSDIVNEIIVQILQWKYQVGPSDGISVADDLIMSRFILHRLSEEFGVGFLKQFSCLSISIIGNVLDYGESSSETSSRWLAWLGMSNRRFDKSNERSRWYKVRVHFIWLRLEFLTQIFSLFAEKLRKQSANCQNVTRSILQFTTHNKEKTMLCA